MIASLTKILAAVVTMAGDPDPARLPEGAEAAVADFLIRAGLDRCKYRPPIQLFERAPPCVNDGEKLEPTIPDERWQRMNCYQLKRVRLSVEGNENVGYRVMRSWSTSWGG